MTDKEHSDLTPANKEILKQNERKMRMFNAMDVAFTKVQEEFDNEGILPSFIEMKEAIMMLFWKVETYEDGAKFAYHMSQLAEAQKPNVSTTFNKNTGVG